MSYNQQLFELYKLDSRRALEKVITDGESSLWGVSFVKCYTYALNDPTLYGSSRPLRRKDLVGRTYEIGFTTDGLTLLWLDHMYDPQTFRSIPLDSQWG